VQQVQYPKVTAHYIPYTDMPDGQTAVVGARDDCGWEVFLPIIDTGMPPDRVRQIEQEVGQMLTQTFVKGYEACGRKLAERMIAQGAPAQA
jgi:hypothetical protein